MRRRTAVGAGSLLASLVALGAVSWAAPVGTPRVAGALLTEESGTITSPAGIGTLLFLVGSIALFVGVELFLRRRRLRSEGEALLRALSQPDVAPAAAATAPGREG